MYIWVLPEGSRFSRAAVLESLRRQGTDFEPSRIARGRWYIPLCPRPLVASNHLLVWIILLWIELVLAQGGVLDIPLCVSYSLRTIVYCLYLEYRDFPCIYS